MYLFIMMYHFPKIHVMDVMGVRVVGLMGVHV
jgi:hypothetical protein